MKLSDFGVSYYMDEYGKIQKNVLGSRDFMSPECIGGDPYGEPSDVWSLGITLYFCAMGTLPYKLASIDVWVLNSVESHGYWDLYFSIRNEDIPLLPSSFSEEFRNFVIRWYLMVVML